MKSPKLQQTNNYNQFILNEANRIVDTDAFKYRKLRDSMSQFGFLPAYPIHCTTKGNRLEIFDGHRRFTVAKELGLPVWFVIYNNGEIDLAFINECQSPWSLGDYVTSQVSRGKSAFRELQRFSKSNNMPLGSSAALLAGGLGQAGAITRRLKTGEFEITDRQTAQKVAELYSELRNISKSCNRSSFLGALTRCIRVKDFDCSRLVDKARKCPGKLLPQPDILSWLRVIEEIYNYQSKAAIPLAFLANEAVKDKVERTAVGNQ